MVVAGWGEGVGGETAVGGAGLGFGDLAVGSFGAWLAKLGLT